MRDRFPSKIVRGIEIRSNGTQHLRVVPTGMTLTAVLEGFQCLKT